MAVAVLIGVAKALGRRGRLTQPIDVALILARLFVPVEKLRRRIGLVWDRPALGLRHKRL
jgi:hypothetical protein